MLQGALDRKEVASTSSPEKKRSTTTASPDKKKKTSKSPIKVPALDAQEEQQPQQVKLLRKPQAYDYHDPLKLLALNVHGTLLDASLLLDRNPNPNLRPTFKIVNRRVLIRPWLSALLCKYFKNFRVGF
jgi:hypothetical protein